LELALERVGFLFRDFLVVQLDYFLELLGKDVTIYGSLLVLLGLE
jgi:hypothetical protein